MNCFLNCRHLQGGKLVSDITIVHTFPLDKQKSIKRESDGSDISVITLSGDSNSTIVVSSEGKLTSDEVRLERAIIYILRSIKTGERIFTSVTFT